MMYLFDKFPSYEQTIHLKMIHWCSWRWRRYLKILFKIKLKIIQLTVKIKNYWLFFCHKQVMKLKHIYFLYVLDTDFDNQYPLLF